MASRLRSVNGREVGHNVSGYGILADRMTKHHLRSSRTFQQPWKVTDGSLFPKKDESLRGLPDHNSTEHSSTHDLLFVAAVAAAASDLWTHVSAFCTSWLLCWNLTV